jgi:type II secretory pathway component PulF
LAIAFPSLTGVADYTTRVETQLKIERLLNMLVPLLTIFMGIAVAGLIGSVLIGLLSINNLAF